MSRVTEIDRQLPQYLSVSFTSGPGRHCQPENQLQIDVDLCQTKEEELALLSIESTNTFQMLGV